jgi:alginate O-acetyltransferase complex protein AlgI
MFSGNENPNFVWIAYVLIYSVPIVLYHLKDLVWESIPSRAKALVEPAVFGAMIWLIIFNSGSAGEFIYFQF